MRSTARLKDSQVSSKEIEAVVNDPDANSLMSSVINRFSRRYTEDENTTLKYEAAWISLETYDPHMNTEFNTHLCNHTRYLCLKRNKKAKPAKFERTNIDMMQFDTFRPQPDTDWFDMEGIMSQLSNQEQYLIREYFENGKTLQEIGNDMKITREAVRQKINKVKRKVKEYALSGSSAY